MSMIRNSSSSSESDSAKRNEAVEQAKQPREQPRQPAAPESVDQFRHLMQQRQGAFAQSGAQSQDAAQDSGFGLLEGEGEAAEQTSQRLIGDSVRERAATNTARHHAVGERGHEESRQAGGERADASLPPAEASAMWQAQLAMRDAATQTQPTQPTSNAAAFADLVERHVRQLAVSDGGASGEDNQVLLRLADDTLPGTDLLLTKTAEGWQLRADVRSRSSYDAIREAGPELARRFAARNLGQLSIDPHFHG